MKSKYSIGVVTSTRADYGLLNPLIKKVIDSDEFKLQLYVTGTHLSHEFGYTIDQIHSDGFPVCEEIDCIVSNDTPSAIGKTASLALTGLVDGFLRNKPDILILLGDRYEILCAALAANFCHIPIAHLHGGEITEGASDDNFRHAITKLSHLHFTSTEEYRKRVIQLGENPERVFNVGAIGLDNIKNMKLLSSEELEHDLGIRFRKKNILLTVHPETLNPGSSQKNIDLLISCLKEFKSDTFFLCTGTNADSDGRIINSRLKEFCEISENCCFIDSLGQLRYISSLRVVDLVLGNSSSGIIEVPSFNIPTINIGNRQQGRLRADSVFDVSWDSDKIHECISKAMKIELPVIDNPYGDGKTADRIIGILKSEIQKNNRKGKKFYNLKWENE